MSLRYKLCRFAMPENCETGKPGLCCRSSIQSADRCLFLLASTTLMTSRPLAGGRAGVLTIWLAIQWVTVKTPNPWPCNVYEHEWDFECFITCKMLFACFYRKNIFLTGCSNWKINDNTPASHYWIIQSLMLYLEACFLLISLRSCMPTLWCTATTTCWTPR